MSKQYSFEYPGTRESFIKSLGCYQNNNLNYFYFNDFIVDIRDTNFKFGVARGGHSGGYWYIPKTTEAGEKLVFEGTIEYISPHTRTTKIGKAADKVDGAFLLLFLLPIIVLFKAVYFFNFLIRRIRKQQIPKETTTEDRLYLLMETTLGCTRKQ